MSEQKKLPYIYVDNQAALEQAAAIKQRQTALRRPGI